MKNWVKWVLFANAYTPFFLILLIRDLEIGAWPPQGSTSSFEAVIHVFGTPYLSWLLILVILVSNVALFFFLKGFLLASEPLRSFDAASCKAGESLNYIVTYIIPFLEFDTRQDLLPLLILLAVIGVIYVHSNLLATNPMLFIAGYRAYELSVNNKEVGLLITKRSRDKVEQKIPVVQVTEDIYLEVASRDRSKRSRSSPGISP